MENRRCAARTLWSLSALISCALCSFASESPLPKAVATLVFSEMSSPTQGEFTWTTVAFVTETSVAVGRCRQDCSSKQSSLILVRSKEGDLRPSEQTQWFDSDLAIHPTSGGQILAGHDWLTTTVVYSADLSTVRDLSRHLSRFSASGRTVGEQARGSWKLYRLTDGLEPLREGAGDLRSVSDEVVVIQNGKAITAETIDGKRLGSFSLSDDVSGLHARLLGNSKLLLPDCRNTVAVVDFAGKRQLNIRQPGLCGLRDTTSSTDGRRILFDFVAHKTSGLRHMLENIQAIPSFGMVGPEDFNREEVRVLDTVTGKSCFDWHRTFPMTYSQIRSAAISPSGGFVAIAVGNTLSLYQLPLVCKGGTRSPQ